MKHIIILGDGMADWKVKELGDKTLLQYANTPYMDLLAKNGRVGRLKTVADGFHPGSEVANSSILGYDQSKVYEGRGPLEAASIGVELAPDDMAIRCNLICIENGNIKNHSCGRLETEEADVLIKFLQEKLGSERVHFYTGIQYRHLLVIKGGNKHLKCTPPHDVPGQPFMPLLVKPEIPEAKETADLINDLILKSQKLLADHPLNKQRVAEGKDPANSIWPWAGGYRPNMTPLTVTYPQIKRGAVITAVDLIRGIGRLAGLRCINVEGATGLFDTNYEGKAQAAIEALKTDDFVYLHVEASDEAGHDGNLKLKLQTIEDLDRRLIGPIYEAVKNFDEPVSIAVLPDHPTPVALRTHTNEPIPFLIYYPGIEADSVQTFDEIAAVDGSYGLFEGDGFINEFMNN
ncbi:MAG: cofactor-independent phosphoglycerate mutase [Bacteroidaceae bacterium]|jgi:2,3-bisphosphoglycerate-independent phosphoglycerate mutase|nr:cofactor-independent phosphoglycerate mutase [Bacteroidaceae bacterium]MBQ3772340.1 cofactor-independent phosphoglycerate mutase [Bacteroidaceae bacterium]MBQ3875746.1 cofactor-independent phosphoglycerate mutase [Bacteroidaceae bacterium]